MKKLFVIFIGVVAVVLCICCGMRDKDIVRIHIRANSDSDYDQAIKLEVRDGISEYLTQVLENADSKSEATAALNEAIPQLNLLANEISGEECTVTLGQEYFPEKTYNDKVYPAGEYTALIINIGSGQGRNWWCVAYPNMCYATEKENVQYRSFIVQLLERIGIL